MNYSNLKEDVICIVNSYLGVLIIELLHPRCIDLFVEPLTSTSLGIGGIFLSSGKTFTYTLSLNVTESGTILIMLTDGFGLLKKYYGAKNSDIYLNFLPSWKHVLANSLMWQN